ncbi:hypothetical protein, partial [Micromonospora echinofusca]
RRRRGFPIGLTLALVVAFGLVACCGGFAWFGYLKPKREVAHRQEIFRDLRVPEGFTRGEPEIREGTGTLVVVYYLTCEKGVCPVTPAERIHTWLTAAGLANTTMQDVGRCLADKPDHDQSCTWTWVVEGCEVEAYLLKGTEPGEIENRQIMVHTSIHRCDR